MRSRHPDSSSGLNVDPVLFGGYLTLVVLLFTSMVWWPSLVTPVLEAVVSTDSPLFELGPVVWAAGWTILGIGGVVGVPCTGLGCLGLIYGLHLTYSLVAPMAVVRVASRYSDR